MKPSRVLPVNEPPNGRVSTRRLTVALGANQLLSWGTTFYLPAVVSGAAARDLHTTSASILGGFSWALLVTGICAPRVGRWIGQRGGRRVLASSTVIFAVGMLVLASAHGTVVWFGGWTILGAGMSLGLYDAAFATAGTLLGRSVAPVITGITLLGGLASTVGWPVGAALTGALGWRGMLLVYAAMHVGIDLPLVLWAVPSGAPVVPAAPELHADRSAVRGRLFAIFCLAGFFTLRWFLSLRHRCPHPATHDRHGADGKGRSGRGDAHRPRSGRRAHCGMVRLRPDGDHEFAQPSARCCSRSAHCCCCYPAPPPSRPSPCSTA